MNAGIAIGVVLTAKTLTRFSQIQEDKPFSQYYLLGTLYSIVVSVLIFFITRGLI